MDACSRILVVGIYLTAVPCVSSQSSMYGQQVNTCQPKEDGFYNTATKIPIRSVLEYYAAFAARSEIECTVLCRRERCGSAYWLDGSRMCYLSNYWPNERTASTNTVTDVGKVSTEDCKHLLAVQPELINSNKHDSSSECTSRSCTAGDHTCRKDCDNGIGVCVANLTDCEEIPVSNIRQWYWPNFNSPQDNGTIVTVTYKKQHDVTSLRVQFRATIRSAYNQTNGCCRWYYTFNDKECTDPGPVEIVWWRNLATDYYRPSRIDGICNNFTAGKIGVKLNVMPCSGYIGDCNTGFSGENVGASLTVEENDIRHGFGNHPQTHGGTASGEACVFPFVYNGKSYSACADVGKDKHWCSTTSNYDTDKRWSYCPGTCPGFSRFNIVQYAWKEEKSEDNGLLYSFDYYKRDPATAIHVIYIVNARYAGIGMVKYTIKFDGKDCSSPGIIDGIYGHYPLSTINANYDGSNAVTGMCNNIRAGLISVQIYVQQFEHFPEVHTGWHQMSRLIIEEIRYDQDVTAVMTADGKLHRLPEHNIHQWWWWSLSDGTDEGPILLISVTYVKQSSLSQLRIYYQGDIRELEMVPGCSRWYLTFNGNECSNPGPIAGVVFQRIMHTSIALHDNNHHVSVIDGFCNLPAGSYNIRMYVQKCNHWPKNEAWTCYNSGCRLVAEEVFTADW